MNVRPLSSALSETPKDLPLGVILAGGASRRFGAPKALAKVGEVPIVERVHRSLASVVPDPVLVTNQPELFQTLGLPTRSDVHGAGRGPLAGLHTALLWAREWERFGVLVVACDMPFVEPGLLSHIVRVGREDDYDAVAPASTSRFGMEPLCAWYSLGALPFVETRLQQGRRALGPLFDHLRTRRLPLSEVARFGDPELLFLNVNTREDRQRAEQIARQSKEPDGQS